MIDVSWLSAALLGVELVTVARPDLESTGPLLAVEAPVAAPAREADAGLSLPVVVFSRSTNATRLPRELCFGFPITIQASLQTGQTVSCPGGNTGMQWSLKISLA